MKSILNILENDSTITDEVSTRIYSIDADQGADFPYIIVDIESMEPHPTMGAASTLDDVFVNVFSVANRQYSNGGTTGAYDLSELVRAALDQNSGTHDTEVVSLIQFQNSTSYHGGGVNNPHTTVEQSYKVTIRR